MRSLCARLVGRAEDGSLFLSYRFGYFFGCFLYYVDVAADSEDGAVTGARVDAFDHVLVQEELLAMKTGKADHGIAIKDWRTCETVVTVLVLAS